jgi:cytochrome-b5 reductase
VAEHILSNPGDKTQVSLVFANVSEEDILLKGRLDELAAQHPGQFKVNRRRGVGWGGV